MAPLRLGRVSNVPTTGGGPFSMSGKRSVPRICQICGGNFLAEPGEVNRGHAQFCSRTCQSASLVQDLPPRFWSKVDKSSDCWIWTAARYPSGYGVFVVKHGVLRPAHRIAYLLTHGAIPDGLELDHLCRNRLCVNPDHLEPVTHQVNCLRGESPSANHARRTSCVNGHPFDERNTHIRPDGSRKCRACDRILHRKVAI